MAGSDRPDETGNGRPGRSREAGSRHDDLAGRSRNLDAALAARRPARGKDENERGSSDATGFGQGLKLSSEFVAGVLVGAGIGWLIDRVAGTSPWGLIVFLLLGFAAGVLNVLRAAGKVAEAGSKVAQDRADGPEGK